MAIVVDSCRTLYFFFFFSLFISWFVDYDVFSMKMKMKMNENVLLGWLFCFVLFLSFIS